MQGRMRRALAGGAIVVATVAGAGAAVAAGVRLGSPQEESKAIVTDAAGRLGVEPSELEEALEQAYAARVDAAVAAGELTQEQGAELKRRIAVGEVPLLGAPGRGRHGHHGGRHHLGTKQAAAAYLGLTEAQLRQQLFAGRTLAQIAQEKGKTVAGLTEAMTAAARKALAEAVAAGRLTKERQAEILADLPARIAAQIDGTGRRGRHRHDDDPAKAPAAAPTDVEPASATL